MQVAISTHQRLPHVLERHGRSETDSLGGGTLEMPVAACIRRRPRGPAVGIKEIRELEASPPAPGPQRIRRPGGGRKKTVDKDPKLEPDLEKLIEPVTRGDPESPLRWTCKSIRRLAGELILSLADVSSTVVGTTVSARTESEAIAIFEQEADAMGAQFDDELVALVDRMRAVYVLPDAIESTTAAPVMHGRRIRCSDRDRAAARHRLADAGPARKQFLLVSARRLRLAARWFVGRPGLWVASLRRRADQRPPVLGGGPSVAAGVASGFGSRRDRAPGL